MKRRIFKLALLLLLGAIVNVAVAWGCASILKPKNISHVSTSREECITQIANYFDILPDGSVYNGHTNRALSFKLQYASRQANADYIDYIIVVRIKSGWPLLSQVGEWIFQVNNNGSSSRFATALMNPWVGDFQQEINFIPYRPLWPGFAINTIIYATILWLLTLGPFTARRMIRSKRGRCIKCGYDLRGNIENGCPECGWGRETEA